MPEVAAGTDVDVDVPSGREEEADTNAPMGSFEDAAFESRKQQLRLTSVRVQRGAAMPADGAWVQADAQEEPEDKEPAAAGEGSRRQSLRGASARRPDEMVEPDDTELDALLMSICRS